MLPVAPNLVHCDFVVCAIVDIRSLDVGGARRDKVRCGTVKFRWCSCLTRWQNFLDLVQHLLPRHAHEIGRRQVLVLAVQQPDWWAVRLPPECIAYDLVRLCNVHLRRDNATLVVDAHQHTHSEIEYNPCHDPGFAEAEAR